jgi:hypothetical protein
MLSFRTLKDELESIAGFHDFEKAHVTSKNAENKIVMTHEALHDRLITETPFGTIQFLINRIVAKSKNPNASKSLLVLIDELFISSKITHEIYATYLSIKTYPLEEHKELLELHPNEYQNYYGELSEIIDPIFHSTYLQYLIGSKIIEICFASRLQERLINLPLNKNITIKDSEKPDVRFRLIIKLLTDDYLNSLLTNLVDVVNESKEKINLPNNFNIQSESDWLSISLNQARVLENTIEDSLRYYLYDHTNNQLDNLFHNEWDDIYNKFYIYIQEYTSIDLSSETKEIYPSNKNYRIARAIRNAESVITNKPVVNLEYQVEFEVFNKDEPYLFTSGSHGQRTLISKFQIGQKIESMIWGYVHIAESETSIKKLKHSHVDKYLNHRKECALSGYPIVEVDSIIIGVHLNENFNEIYSYIQKAHSNKYSSFYNQNIVWYLLGNTVEWINWFGQTKNFTYMPLLPLKDNVAWDDYIEKSKDLAKLDPKQSEIIEHEKFMDEGIQGNVFYNKNLLGTFFRWHTREVSATLSYPLSLFKWKELPFEQRERIAKASIESLKPISILWSEY